MYIPQLGHQLSAYSVLQSIVSFSVGLNLLQSKLHLASVLALDVLFALMSPSGLLAGLYIDSYQPGPRQQLFSGMLQGIACGTFLYITCFEVLPREFHSGQSLTSMSIYSIQYFALYF